MAEFFSISTTTSDFYIRVQTMMDTIAWSEGTDFKNENTGYNLLIDGVSFNGTTKYTGDFKSYGKPNTLEKWGKSYNDNHPNILIKWRLGSDKNPSNFSSASGRYQILFPVWTKLAPKYFIQDFTPQSQDRMCIVLLEKSFPHIKQGQWELAIKSICKTWPSLPGAGYSEQTSFSMNQIINKLKEYYATNKTLSPEAQIFINQYFPLYIK
jgi:muramidase (phage lysozyme)